MPKDAARMNRRGLPKIQIAVISTRGPGTNSARVGVIFLKMVVGVAINPWGSASSRKCAQRAPADTITALSELSMDDGMIHTVIEQDTAICVVVVIVDVRSRE